MTEQEAIEVLTDKNTTVRTKKCDDVAWRKLKPAIDTAVKALEKQIAISRTIIEGKYFCPRCKYVMRHPGYCRKCGQHAY